MQLSVFKCAWCGEHLTAPSDGRQMRSDKRFCCTAHRVKHNRWLKMLKSREARAVHEIKLIAEYLQHAQAQATAAEILVRLTEIIKVEARANGMRGVR